MLRTATIYILVFAFGTVLVSASTPVAFGQVDKGLNSAHAAEQEKKAEELFREAVTLSATKERELTRLRLLEATRLWIQLHEPQKAASANLQMGDYYKQNKKYMDSLYYYQQALETKALSGAAKANAFYSIAQIYAELYQSNLALHYYHKAIKQAQMIKDITTQTLAWTGLAELHHRQGEKGQAITCIAHAQRLNRQQNNENTEATLTHLTGLIKQEQGMAKEARKAFEEALKIYRKIGDKHGEVRVLCSFSNLNLAHGQQQPALEQAELAVKLAEEQSEEAHANPDPMRVNADITRARDLRWRAWLSHARAQRAVGHKEIAVKSYQRAILQIQGLYILLYMSTEASAVAFREECHVPYMELTDLLIEQGLFKEAYERAEEARARVMTRMMAARRITGQPKKSDQEDKERELSRSIIRLQEQLQSPQINTEQRASFEDDLREAEDKLKEAKIKSEMERSRENKAWALPATIKMVQENIAQDKRVVLEFFLGEKRSFAWLISSNDISLAILPGKREIEKAVKGYVELMTGPPNNMYINKDIARGRERAEKLFSMLFGRLAEQIVPGQKLIVVPDGALYYLPFEALIHNGHYLLEDHEINYIPSPSMLGSEKDSVSRAETEDKMEFLAFGDPIFGPGPKASDRKEFKSRPGDIAQQVRTARGFNLAPLPRTRDEVQYIASLFPSNRQHVYLGKDSTEKAVKQESLHHYKRLHFATHSLIDESSPTRSAVVLTLNNDSEEDGFLEVSEIAEMDLDCNLVVLSACQTGRGQLLSGEGIVGLSRAFLYAGARSVVVSLWNVSDISTGQFMKYFYQNIINNTGNTAALREAKIRMLKSNTEMRHPYYWAPFIIVGRP